MSAHEIGRCPPRHNSQDVYMKRYSKLVTEYTCIAFASTPDQFGPFCFLCRASGDCGLLSLKPTFDLVTLTSQSAAISLCRLL